MGLAFFLLRLLALALVLAFFLISGAVYIVIMGLAWLITGEPLWVKVTYPKCRP